LSRAWRRGIVLAGQSAGAWGIGLIQDFRADARQTFRSLGRSPVFAGVAVLTLGLGVGGTTAIFSVVNGVLLKPLPYEEPGELVSVHHSDNTASQAAYPLSAAFYFTFRDHARSLEEIGLYRETPVTVTGLDRPERVDALQMTEGLLPLLGIRPAMGRLFIAEDVAPGTGYPIILTHRYWQGPLGGDPEVLSRTLRVEGGEREILGVLPPGARLPATKADMILPLVFNRARTSVGNFSFQSLARLRPGVTPEAASLELAGMTARATEEYPGIPLSELRAREFTSLVRPFQETVVGGADRILWVVFGTVSIVLLIACANVANLFLVRAEARQVDTALRAALGASRPRLTRQLFTESLLVGLMGGAFGLLLAMAGVRVLLSMAPSSIPRLDEIGMDPAVLGFALGISVLTGVLFGSVPVFRLGQAGLVERLKNGGRGSSVGGGRFRFRTFFAVSQVAMALVLLVASGLMVRTFQELRAVPAGFQGPEEVLTFRVGVPSSEAQDADEATRFLQAILEEVGRLPGVTSASGAASVAMEGWQSWDGWEVEGFPAPEGQPEPSRRINWMVPGYHQTIRNPVLAGRSLEWADIYDRRNVALVTENFAREYWGNPERALGRRIRNSSGSPWREIVGVVGNVHTQGVAVPAPLVVYLPFITANFWGIESFSVRELRYVIRTDRPNPMSLLPEVRQSVWSIHPHLAVADAITLDGIFGQSVSRTSFTLVMLGIAAAVALLLGMVGVYGVISYIVSQRTREMGVRIAMGASCGQVRRMVLLQGGTVALVGTIVGVFGALGLTRLMANLLFGVSPLDPVTYAVVAAVLGGFVLL
ncbi:MAG: ABC transporter permease, partial [Longimicrobiales bacterium]